MRISTFSHGSIISLDEIPPFKDKLSHCRQQATRRCRVGRFKTTPLLLIVQQCAVAPRRHAAVRGDARSSKGWVQNTRKGEDYAPPPLRNRLLSIRRGKFSRFLTLFLIERPLQRTIIYHEGCNAPISKN